MEQVPRFDVNVADDAKESQGEPSSTTVANEQCNGGDVVASVKESLSWISNRLPVKPEYLESVRITKDDFKMSLKRVQPSSKREGFATVPDVTWDDVGSLKDIREALQMAILVRARSIFDTGVCSEK